MKLERIESYHNEKLRGIAFEIVTICQENNITRSEWKQLIALIESQAAEKNNKLPLFVND